MFETRGHRQKMCQLRRCWTIWNFLCDECTNIYSDTPNYSFNDLTRDPITKGSSLKGICWFKFRLYVSLLTICICGCWLRSELKIGGDVGLTATRPFNDLVTTRKKCHSFNLSFAFLCVEYIYIYICISIIFYTSLHLFKLKLTNSSLIPRFYPTH